MQNLQIRYVNNAIARIPPMTAPAMAPTFGGLLAVAEADGVEEEAAAEGSSAHFVNAQVSQVGATKVQV
jgi:folate-dependent phosphoribosylglycinamide formyltransferase PurN